MKLFFFNGDCEKKKKKKMYLLIATHFESTGHILEITDIICIKYLLNKHLILQGYYNFFIKINQTINV